MVRARPLRAAGRKSRLAASLLLLAAAACSRPAPEPAPGAARATEWRTFEGTWTAIGERHSLEVAGGRQASIVHMSGSLLLTGERGLGVGFQSRVIAFSDGATSSVGRAVWTDERGDQIFSEFRGAPVATGRSISGTITGGTGRWRGLTGEYGFEWTWVVDIENRIQGRTVGLRGRARIVPEGVVP